MQKTRVQKSHATVPLSLHVVKRKSFLMDPHFKSRGTVPLKSKNSISDPLAKMRKNSNVNASAATRIT